MRFLLRRLPGLQSLHVTDPDPAPAAGGRRAAVLGALAGGSEPDAPPPPVHLTSLTLGELLRRPLLHSETAGRTHGVMPAQDGSSRTALGWQSPLSSPPAPSRHPLGLGPVHRAVQTLPVDSRGLPLAPPLSRGAPAEQRPRGQPGGSGQQGGADGPSGPSGGTSSAKALSMLNSMQIQTMQSWQAAQALSQLMAQSCMAGGSGGMPPWMPSLRYLDANLGGMSGAGAPGGGSGPGGDASQPTAVPLAEGGGGGDDGVASGASDEEVGALRTGGGPSARLRAASACAPV